jgi:hypothetical protein
MAGITSGSSHHRHHDDSAESEPNMKIFTKIASLRTAASVVAVVFCWAQAGPLPPLVAAPVESPDLGTSASVPADAVTLKLRFQGEASEGSKFHVQGASLWPAARFAGTERGPRNRASRYNA